MVGNRLMENVILNIHLGNIFKKNISLSKFLSLKERM